ncbi:carbamoyltransferase HypF [Oscillospiraceae bacterium HV4-5-C5C]|nr:carbamoyltransferase HypF [Oscillospiraceae bacterium HV4-5-C5C]
MKRLAADIQGIVQGVGFRPFVAREAMRLGLTGFVRNTPAGVELECEGPESACEALLQRLRQDPPPGAVIFSLASRELPPSGERTFRILSSDRGEPAAAVSPDLGICADCARELFDPADRRYRYPFINCTACGPRFTILKQVPYDRANTTMAGFTMCPDCDAEYHDPSSRRFHAQPDACAVCGPVLTWLEGTTQSQNQVTERFEAAIRAGKIVAVKGLGGFNLACDAQNEPAVRQLRQLKRRYAKPLAVMVRDLAQARTLCEISPAEARELESVRRPIVLLKKNAPCQVAPSVAPDTKRLGVMLAYTPLHLLLLEHLPPLVMTSANGSDQPMYYRDEDLARLRPLCQAVVTHNRPILRRVDDSVCVFAAGRRRLLRRARGFAPAPLPIRLPGQAAAGTSQPADQLSQAGVLIPQNSPEILALGAQQKNSFCFLKQGLAYLSGHIGDLEDEATLAFLQQEIPAFLKLFGGHPQTLVTDQHPDYASVRLGRLYAREHPGARLLTVQHHHAHFASVLAEHGLSRALGLIFDGTGYGSDGLIWGGECLAGTAAHSRRLARLRPLRLPGAAAAVREPWRTAMSAVADACGEQEALDLFGRHSGAANLLKLCRRGQLAPLSSGMGRLFDVFAVLAGLPELVSYEGQDAALLEQLCEEDAAGSYEFELCQGPEGLVEFDWRAAVRDALRDRGQGIRPGIMAERFHRAVTRLVRDCARRYPDWPAVVLSGGVFQNVHLLESCLAVLTEDGRRVYTNEQVPANDGGISYGQAAAAWAILKEEAACV